MKGCCNTAVFTLGLSTPSGHTKNIPRIVFLPLGTNTYSLGVKNIFPTLGLSPSGWKDIFYTSGIRGNSLGYTYIARDIFGMIPRA